MPSVNLFADRSAIQVLGCDGETIAGHVPVGQPCWPKSRPRAPNSSTPTRSMRRGAWRIQTAARYCFPRRLPLGSPPAVPRVVGNSDFTICKVRLTLLVDEWTVAIVGTPGSRPRPSKMAHEIRLLSHLRNLEEPFEKDRWAPRECPTNATHALGADLHAGAPCDRAGRRPRAHGGDAMAGTDAGRFREQAARGPGYMATDAILLLAANVAGGLRVNEGVVAANLGVHLPFMVMEAVMMGAAGAGGDRQDVHERIRGHALEAARRMAEGEEGGLFERAGDEVLEVSAEKLEAMARPEGGGAGGAGGGAGGPVRGQAGGAGAGAAWGGGGRGWGCGFELKG